MAEALQDTPKHQMEVTLKSVPSESVSLGRFADDSSLSWDKWSAFSQNKYMEEAEKCSTPGSVAEKKAYFEAHYKKIAAHAMELLAQDKQPDQVGQSKSEGGNSHQSCGSSELSDSTNVDLEQLTNCSSDSIHAHDTSHFTSGCKEEKSIEPDFSEAEVLKAMMDTAEPKLEALESIKNEGVNEPEKLEAEFDEAKIMGSELDLVGDKTEVSANKIAIGEVGEVGTEADASASKKKDELGCNPETLTSQLHETCGVTEILEAEVDELMAAKLSEEKVNEANGHTDVYESKLDIVGSKNSEAMANEMETQPDCSVSDVDLVVRGVENFTETHASEKTHKSPAPKMDRVRRSPMIKLSKKKSFSTAEQADSDAAKKRQTITPASPKPKLSSLSTPKASKVTPRSALTPASKASLRKDPAALRSEHKRESPTLLDFHKLRPVSVDLASPLASRRDLIMDKMGEKEIVQKAFKTFRNSLNMLRSSYDGEKSSTYQQPVMKGKHQPETPAKTHLQRKQPGPRSPNMTRSLNDSNGTKRMIKAGSPSQLGLRSDEGAKKQKDLLSALNRKPNSKESTRTNLQMRSKDEKLEKLQQASKYKVTQMPTLDRLQGMSGNHLNK